MLHIKINALLFVCTVITHYFCHFCFSNIQNNVAGFTDTWYMNTKINNCTVPLITSASDKNGILINQFSPKDYSTMLGTFHTECLNSIVLQCHNFYNKWKTLLQGS